MPVSETKKLFFSLLILLLAIFALSGPAAADEYSSASYSVLDPAIDSGTQTSASANFGLGQSLSQMAIGRSSSASFQLWSGFQYYFSASQHALTATPGDGEADLSWTVPQTFLGASVAGYEVGTGTVSGSYVFEDVGNVVNFTKTGLTNGTQYFFIVKAYAPGGAFLVFSNEDSATPNGAPPPGGGGGGGASQQKGSVAISGQAYPGAQISLLVDSELEETAVADSGGNFSFSIENLNSGSYSMAVYAVDSLGLKSPSLSFEQEISSGVASTVAGLVVAPTLKASHSTIKQGEPITFSGHTQPNRSIDLYFSGPAAFTRTAASAGSGFYSYALDTSGLNKGAYTVYSGQPAGAAIQFTVGDETVLPPSGPCAARSDLNCDSRVDLIDFSILLYFWEAADFSANPRADIDGLGSVDLKDLSIMLYDWTG